MFHQNDALGATETFTVTAQISFCKVLKYKKYQVKVLVKRFHLNGHTTGFYPQTQKLEPP